MIEKEFIQCLFYTTLFEKTSLTILDEYSQKDTKNIKIEGLISKNGILGFKLFSFPQKIISYLKLIDFYIFKFKNNKNYSYKFKTCLHLGTIPNKNYNFIKNLKIRTNQLGHLLYLEGIIVSLGERRVKNFKTNKFFFKQRRSNDISDLNFSKKREGLKVKKRYFISDYQEAKIIFNNQKLTKNVPKKDLEILSVFFSGKLVDKCIIGDKVSIWGILKYKHFDNNQSKHKIDFSLEVISLSNKKKINIKEKTTNSQNSKTIDFFNNWNDSKIRRKNFSTRNKLIKSFLPTIHSIPVLKLLIITVLIGATPSLNIKEKYENLVLGIITNITIGKGNILKTISSFWKNFISVNSYEILFKKNAIEITKDKLKKHFYLRLIKNLTHKNPIFCISKLPPKLMEDIEFTKKSIKNISITITTYKKFFRSDILPSNFFTLDLNSLGNNVDSYLERTNIFEKTDFLYFLTENFTKRNNLEIQLNFNRFNFEGYKESDDLEISKSKWYSKNIKNSIEYSRSYFYPKYNLKAEEFLANWYLKWKVRKTSTVKKILFLEKIIHLSQAYARLLWQNFITIHDCILSMFIIQYTFKPACLGIVYKKYFEHFLTDEIMIKHILKKTNYKFEKKKDYFKKCFYNLSSIYY